MPREMSSQLQVNDGAASSSDNLDNEGVCQPGSENTGELRATCASQGWTSFLPLEHHTPFCPLTTAPSSVPGKPVTDLIM